MAKLFDEMLLKVINASAPIITRVSGYVDTPTPKKCGTCKYLEGNSLCGNMVVRKDPQVPTCKQSGLKKVSAANGCCNYWEP
jgi:hypothetical protein